MDKYSWEAQITKIVPVGLTPAGLRMDVHFSGHLNDGELAGAELNGIDYLLLRPDGVGVIDARESIISSNNAGAVHARALGYIVPPFPMPPLAALLEPDFSWPDVDLPMHGAVQLETGEANSALNRTVFSFTGTVNVASGKLGIQAQSIA